MLRCLLLLLAAITLRAQSDGSSWEHQFSGYYKTLFTGSRTIVNQIRYGDLLNRLRLGYDGRYQRWMQVNVEYDNQLHAGNLIPQPEFALIRGRQDSTWIDAQRPLVEREHLYWDTSLYRGYVSLRSATATLTVGRQRIGWGTARFWSPSDVFNPISPLAIEGTERQGVDAAYLQWNVAPNLTWSTAVLPESRLQNATAATRLSTNLAGYDVAGFVGRFGEDWMTGAEVAGQWGGAGLRGEVTYRSRSDDRPEKDAFRFTAGADYAFPNTLYLVGEYFYNEGQPAFGPETDPTALFRFTSEIFTMHRHFVSGGVSYDVTPLLRLEAYTVADLAGSSLFIQPQVTYNLKANVDLTGGAQLYASGTGGEFEPLSNLVFGGLLVHF